MTADEHKLILSLVKQGLPQLEFLRQFRGATDPAKLTASLLEDAFTNRNADDVEYALMVGFTFGFSDAHVDVLIRLASVSWHRKHEDIITALGRLRDAKAGNVLWTATQQIPDYLAFDESRALAVKAIWALGKLPGSEAESALRKLAASNVSVIRDAALQQLERRKA